MVNENGSGKLGTPEAQKILREMWGRGSTSDEIQRVLWEKLKIAVSVPGINYRLKKLDETVKSTSAKSSNHRDPNRRGKSQSESKGNSGFSSAVDTDEIRLHIRRELEEKLLEKEIALLKKKIERLN